ncbi:DUF523 domain-containing protein [Plantactinospora endophytica]|uniref:DUF523 domain-containing protein n=1 Tax=Plantactinospora endophytica TaxID=673535 RepID=A0ABQ4E9E6_9ACTN|nr:DUF523 domain-containing protein [Plantactinospora endophytica]GIG91362.1 hypothetical protein Pen02_62980 [Plantactinospora endophytica]
MDTGTGDDADTLATSGPGDAPLFLMSACLAGTRCAYDGGAAKEEVAPGADARVRLVCPEVMGGLGTPRDRAEIVGGDGFDVLDGRARVLTYRGEDVTEAYLAGARRTLRIARDSGAAGAVLQDYSPSCGCRQISDGTFRRNRVGGQGVTAALLLRNGFQVVAHHEYDPSAPFPSTPAPPD